MATDTDTAIPQFPGVGSNAEAVTSRLPIFRDGDPQQRMISISDLGVAIGNTALGLDSITETVLASEFTDGVGTAVGTYVMTDAVPAGAILLGAKVIVNVGFLEDTTCTMTIGDGSDVDRYNTGTINIFAAEAVGIECGAPSGTTFMTAANTPTLTATGGADYTTLLAGAGSITVSIFFLRTVAA